MTQDGEESETPKDPFVHRMIPTVAAVGLTLGAGACGGSDGTTRPSKDELRNYCSDRRDCVGENDFGFDSLNDCADYYDDEIAYYTNVDNPEITQACADASMRFFNCALDTASCDMGEFYYDPEACESEYYAQYDACYGDDSGSM
mgnify:CR=1 FL=1